MTVTTISGTGTAGTRTTTTTTTTPTQPTATSNIVSYCGCTNITLSLTGITFGTVGVTYQWQSSPASMNTWTNIDSSNTSYARTVTSQSNTTDYRCVITSTIPALMIFTSTIVTITTAFCTPYGMSFGCGSQDTINDFILVGESNTRIYDVGTGCQAGSYSNRGLSVTLFANTTYTAFVSTQYSSSELVAIWIDFNDNGVFETAERITLGNTNSILRTPQTLVIPAIGSGATVGTHRMRVSLAYATTPSPCNTGVTYGELQDYTVTILAYTRKLYLSYHRRKANLLVNSS